MSHRILIAIIVLALMLPVSHWYAFKQGRVSLHDEFVSKNAYVMEGKLAFKELTRVSGTCGNCHIDGGV